MAAKKPKELPGKALEGIKVLEYGGFVSAPMCTKLLADLGAEVIKVEPPWVGDKARRRGPFLQDIPHPERSALFLYLNINKLSITLDVNTATGKRIFKELIRETDLLVENQPAGRMKELALDYQSLSQVNPRLVMTSITPFGQTGPYSTYKSYPLNTYHAGGEGYCLPGGLGWLLYSDRPPIKMGAFVGECDTGVSAASAALAALIWRETTNKGQHIDISQQEVLLNLVRFDIASFNTGWVESRATRSFPIAGLMQCKDGFVQVMPLLRHMWEALVDLVGNPEWAKQEDFDNLMARFYSGDRPSGVTQQEVNKRLEKWMLQHTKEEIYHGGQARGLAVGIVSSVEDLFQSKQLKARDFFAEIEHPETGQIPYPSAPYKYSETPWRVERPAPGLGEDNVQIYSRRMGYSQEDLVRMRQAGVI